ncbi:MAG TPA: DNA repair protein RecO [Candidatus Saccharimonadales bacterium]|nr:DNA repair protein RecO [Candidatus Saccharimonadales bacterium]
MPTRISEAFVLDATVLKERDKIVTLFTEEEGKLRGLAHGAARSVKRFGGRLERLSRVRASWFEKEGQDLVRIDDLELVRESFSMHQDLLKSAAISYICELAEEFTREKEADRRYYRLLVAVLDGLRAGISPALLLRYFEFWTGRLHGILPAFGACDGCGRAFGAHGARVAPRGEAALCERCAPGSDATMRLSRGALGLIEAFRNAPPSEFAHVVYPAGALREVETAAVSALVAFTGREIRSAPFLRQVMAEERK